MYLCYLYMLFFFLFFYMLAGKLDKCLCHGKYCAAQEGFFFFFPKKKAKLTLIVYVSLMLKNKVNL